MKRRIVRADCTPVCYWTALPDELVVMLLEWAFPLRETLNRQFAGVSAMRAVSKRLAHLVTHAVYPRLQRLPAPALSQLSNATLPLFEGLTDLDLVTSSPLIQRDSLTCLQQLRSFRGPLDIALCDLPVTDQLTRLRVDSDSAPQDAYLRRFTALRSLHLGYNDWTPGHALLSMSCLVTLEMVGNIALHDDTLSRLTALHTLKMSGLQCASDAGISTLTRLTDLALTETRHLFDGSTLQFLTGLVSLNLRSNTHVRGDHLPSLPRLATLRLVGATGIAGGFIAQLTGLRRLSLAGNSNVRDEHLAPLTGLTRLNLAYNWTITDEGLSGLTNLTRLNLASNTGVDEAVWSLSRLQRLNLYRKGNAPLEYMHRLTQLRELNIAHETEVLSAFAMPPLCLVRMAAGCVLRVVTERQRDIDSHLISFDCPVWAPVEDNPTKPRYIIPTGCPVVFGGWVTH